MEDLRWVLLLVGIVVVAAIYLSGRFENDDWKRERKRFHDGKLKRSIQKAHAKATSSEPARFVEKKEPSISTFPQSSIPESTADLALDSKAESQLEVQTSPASEQVMETAKPVPISVQNESEQNAHVTIISEQEETATIRAEESLQKEEAVRVDEPVVVSKQEAEPESKTLQVTQEDETVPESVEIEEKQPSSAEQAQVEEQTEKDSFELNVDSELEDEITDIEIPLDLEVAEAQLKINEAEEKQEPTQAEMKLDIEPLVLSVSIVAEDSEGFPGDILKEAMEAEGLAHGAMRIFHYYDPNKEDVVEHDDAVFSAANLLEPGYFELETMADMRTPGLMLFCQLPGPLEGEAALELMLDKGRGLAVRLHGQMCDDKRNVFTAQAKTYYLDKIATFNREVELARKKVKT